MDLIDPNTLLQTQNAQIDHAHAKFVRLLNQMPQANNAEFSKLFTELAQHTEQHSEKSPVVLFVDTFNNYFNPEVADAAVKVLQAAGYAVKIARPSKEQAEPERPLCCGRTYFSNSMIDKARFEAQRLLTVLLPEVEAGAVIIGLEPSCILSLCDEYLTLGLGEGAKKLAANVLIYRQRTHRQTLAA